jgi:hypothetical protein
VAPRIQERRGGEEAGVRLPGPHGRPASWPAPGRAPHQSVAEIEVAPRVQERRGGDEAGVRLLGPHGRPSCWPVPGRAP